MFGYEQTQTTIVGCVGEHARPQSSPMPKLQQGKKPSGKADWLL